MAASGKPWAAVLIVAVLSRLMSTDGRPLRLQQQQLLERAGYQNPEFDIDRTYELMNEKRGRIQHHPRRQPVVTASNDRDDDVDRASRLGGGTQLLDQPAAATDGRPVAGITPAHATTPARNVTKTALVHSPEPKYHYEVHSVQHNPERYATAEQKLRAVVRQAAAVEHQLRDSDDDVRQTLIDDSEHHNQRMKAARKTSPHIDKELHAPPGRHRLEQLRHVEDEIDELGELRDDSDDDYDGYEYRSSLQQIADDAKPDEKVAVQVRVDQNEAAANGESAQRQSAPADTVVVVGHDGSTAQKIAEAKQRNGVDTPVALPLQDARGRPDEESAVNAAASASSIADIYFLAVVIGCSVAGIAGFLFAGLCWYRLQKKMKAASEVDYPAYGVTGPATNTTGPGKVPSNVMSGGSPGDKKLAQNAQMYHFHHQKQQMIASERRGSDVNQHVGGTGSDAESEEENEDGDYTVFECPGLATNGEMEVRNPMFNDPTPVGTPADASGLYQQAKK